MNPAPTISLSVVSHRQARLVRQLLGDIAAHVAGPIEVFLTVNVRESIAFQPADFNFPLHIATNPAPKGFGANHNAAFSRSAGKFFCVLNPDIRLESDPFPPLVACFGPNRIGVAAPLITAPDGRVEDSARRFPTPLRLLKKAAGMGRRIDYAIGTEPFCPEWVAGMFMVFPRDVFEAMGGFDERYFLYYEDIDLCARLRIGGYKAIVCPAVSAVHDARRQSHRSLRYIRWHLASILRFFLSPSFFKAVILRQPPR